MFTGHWYITVSYKTVQLQKGTFQNSTLNNDTLQNGMFQNGKALQNGNVLKNGKLINRTITYILAVHVAKHYNVTKWYVTKRYIIINGTVS